MMAGVVRRDGLREAVSLRARLERERDVLERLAHHPCPCPRDTPVPEVAAVDAIIDHLARVLDAVPDVPPTTPLADHIKAGMLRGRVRLPDEPDEVCPKCGRPHGDVDVAVVLPDVPPDPPAADRDELARVLFETDYDPSIPEWGEWGVYPPDDQAEYLALADALLSSGVLVDAADVRARAWRWAASFGTFPGKSWPETLRYHAEHGAAFDRDEPDYFDEQGVSEREGASDG